MGGWKLRNVIRSRCYDVGGFEGHHGKCGLRMRLCVVEWGVGRLVGVG